MLSFYDKTAPTKRVTLGVNSTLLKQAKDLNIDLSATLEQALFNQLKVKHAQLWLDQNKNAIAAYNKSVNEIGVFSDGLRFF